MARQKRDHAPVVVSAEHLSAHLRRHHEQRAAAAVRYRSKPQIVFLQRHHFAATPPRREARQIRGFRPLTLRLLPQRLHFLDRRPRAIFAPCSARRRSTCAKRCRNLALVRRSACSGSTFTNRARFTITNSRSPSSSSICSCVPRSRALRRTPPALRPASRAPVRRSPNRSPPAAAREVICCASTSAGNARGTLSSSPCGPAAFSFPLLRS